MPGFYFTGFWPDIESSEKNFIMSLFSEKNNWETDPSICQYVITSVFGLKELKLNKIAKWIHIVFEPFEITIHERCNLTIETFKREKKDDKSFYLPFSIYYIHLRNLLEKLNKPELILKSPKKFCCFLSSSAYGLPEERRIMFEKLNEYRHVDSWGSHLNNTGKKLECNYHSSEFIHFLRDYKFIIAFENRKMPGYITEKIVNPLIAGIIPIYWGCETLKELFNPERYIYVNNVNNDSLDNVIEKIKFLDNSDEEYLKVVNKQNILDNDLFNLEKLKKNLINN